MAEPDFMPASARVAWTYLATLIALVAAGVVVVLGNQTVGVLVCTGAGAGAGADVDADDLAVTCRLWWAIWLAIGGFLVALLPAVRALKLDWWLWLTLVAGSGLLVALDSVTDWWWWLLAALLPAAAALASADWERGPRVRRAQLGALIGLAVAAVAALIWWYLG
ncbi:MAG TPA: hypothetical protein PKV13_07870 [Propionicimonas sp.]|nr:hypothetical protein [Propionicimonas sp.]HRA06521.1 hypothetical protein [Propionicimonas sp.]